MLGKLDAAASDFYDVVTLMPNDDDLRVDHINSFSVDGKEEIRLAIKGLPYFPAPEWTIARSICAEDKSNRGWHDSSPSKEEAQQLHETLAIKS